MSQAIAAKDITLKEMKFLPPQVATVYTQVGSELVSIRAEWTQTVGAREIKEAYQGDVGSDSQTNPPDER